MVQFDKKLESIIWEEYSKNPNLSLKKLAKNHDVKPCDVKDFIDSKKKSKKRRTIAGVLSLGLAAVLGYCAFLPETKIYTSPVEDFMHNKQMFSVLESKLKNEKVKKIKVTSYSGRTFVELDHNYNIQNFQPILDNVNLELDSLYLCHDYRVQILKHSWQLYFKDDRRVWMVKNMGTEASGEIEATLENNTIKTGKVGLIYESNGSHLVTTLLSNGKIDMIKNQMFVRTKSLESENYFTALYAEPMHSELLKCKESIIRELTQVKKTNGEFVYLNVQDTGFAACATDEAVVHGLCQNWLEENLDKFGLTSSDLLRDISEKESIYTFKGVKVIRKMVNEQGRKAVLKSYMASPISFWKIIQSNVPEYSGILNK